MVGNILLLVFCLAAGILLRQARRLPEATPSVLNGFIINIGLPATALAYLHKIEMDGALRYAILAPWLMFILGAIILWLACRAMALSRATTGCLILVGGLANTSFVGIPMIEAFYGAEWMGVGVVMDQLGSYMVLAVLGIVVARIFAAGPRPDPKEIIGRILIFPPFVATIAALAFMWIDYPEWVQVLLERLASTVAPLALVSVGFQLRLSDVKGRLRPLALGLAYNLVLGPLLVVAAFIWLLGERGMLMQVTVFELAMAPMIGASIVAMENDLDPQLATLLVGIGVPLSFLTVTGWYYLLAGV